jgi:ribosome-interacting GTPase 1
MPANLTPDYMAAEARFKAAREPTERVEALEEMLRVIPKHKGTDHLRGDLRRKLSALREEARSGGKKGAVRRADPGYVPSQGAGQVVLLGPSNTGKSSLVTALTRAEPEVAPYPYTTRKPLPAMMMFEDAPVQLVDCPAMDPAVYQPWMNALARNADFGLVVLDPAAVGVLEAVDVVEALVGRGRARLVPAWWAVGQGEAGARAAAEEDLAGQELDDDELLARLEPGDVELPVVVVVNKIDHGDNREQFRVLAELIGDDWPLWPVSASTGEGLAELRKIAFTGLRVMRVYAKPPGKPPSTKEPIILPLGATVRDMARIIHKDLEAKLRFARIWSDRHFEGQRIPRDAVLQDRDIVEINA